MGFSLATDATSFWNQYANAKASPHKQLTFVFSNPGPKVASVDGVGVGVDVDDVAGLALSSTTVLGEAPAMGLPCAVWPLPLTAGPTGDSSSA